MNALNLLRDLEARGVALTPHDGLLVVNAPVGALTAADRDLLYRLKPDLLAILEASLTPDDLSEDWRFAYEERIAIMQPDENPPLEQIKAAAFEDTLRRMREAGIDPRPKSK